MRWVGWAGLVVGWCAATSLALAQTRSQCPEPPDSADDVPKVVPTDSATQVARNTAIQVDLDAALNPYFALFRKVPNPDYDPDDPDKGPEFFYPPVTATWQRVGESNRFAIRPTALLDAEQEYKFVVRADTGIAKEFDFTTSAIVDTAPPTFSFGPDAVESISSTPCGEEGTSYSVGITPQPASDNAAPGGIEYLLYLTRAQGLDGPELVARQYLAIGSTMSFTLTPEQLETPVCIVMDAIDGVGLHANPQDIQEYCFDPLQGNFFEPCRVGGRAQPGERGAIVLLISLVFAALHVRARRLRRASSR